MLLLNVLHSNNYHYVNYAEFGAFGNKRITLGFFYILKNKIKDNENNPLLNVYASMGYLACCNFSHVRTHAEMVYSHSAICNFSFIIFHKSLTLRICLLDAGDCNVYLAYFNLDARSYSKQVNINLFWGITPITSGLFMKINNFIYTKHFLKIFGV